jgi:hypothetical protein
MCGAILPPPLPHVPSFVERSNFTLNVLIIHNFCAEEK